MPEPTIYRHNAPISGSALACGALTGAGDTAIRDTAAIEQGYRSFADRFRASGGRLDDTPIVPRTVGHNGAMDPAHARQVDAMINCVGSAYQMDPGVVGEIRGMYRDSVSIERAAHRNGVHTH